MDFRELQYISAVAKYQNMTKAAESLYVGQPTLSKALAKVEEEYSVKLFRKLGNKFIPTYAGEVFVKKAEQILLLGHELNQELSDIAQNDVGLLRVSFPVMRGSYMLPCTIPIFKKLYPRVKLNIIEASSKQLEGMLLRGETDLAFFNRPVKNKLLDYTVIAREPLLLLLKEGHPLAKKALSRAGDLYPWMDIRYLEHEPFILFTESQRTRQIADQLFEEAGFSPEIFLQTRNIEAALQLAAQGYGACFCSDTHLRHISFEHKPLCFRVGTPPITMDFVAASRRGTYLPPYTREYINIVKQFT